MKRSIALGSVVALSIWAGGAGCQNVTAIGDLDSLSEDANQNGYLDVEPPAGIEFLTLTNLRIRLANAIDQGDVAALASANGIDPSLLAFANIAVTFTITMDYGGGITDVLQESEPITSFEKRFEVACPLSAVVDVVVTASAPVVGELTIFEASYTVTEGVEYSCGEAIAYETYVDESGNPQVSTP